MTLTISPAPEAMLLAKAERAGQEVNQLTYALLADISQEEARDRAEMIEGIRRGLEDSDAGRVRPFSEFAAEMRAKYHLPPHLSDEEIFSGEESISRP